MSYHSPARLDHALSLVARSGGKIIAGGTDLFPAAKQGQMPRELIDISTVDGLSDIVFSADQISIGAATRWSDIIRADLPAPFNMLKQAALEIGGIQIQNSGTVGGNLCNASPAADGIPPLLALDARVELVSAARGARIMKLADFLLHVRKTALARDEILSRILVPKPAGNARSAFEKLASRRYMAISISMVAAIITYDCDERIASAAIAVGACSPVACRLERLEAALIGAKLQDIVILAEHLSALSPIDDIRASAEYRLDAVAEQVRRAIMRTAQAEY